MKHGTTHCIGYLAPEIPSLSTTFVYEELLGLEERGITVIPISVRRPSSPAQGKTSLSDRVCYLYETGKLKLVFSGLIGLFRVKGSMKAIYCLTSDLFESGILRLDTWKLVFQFVVAIKVSKILIKQNCSHLHVHFAHVPTQIAMYASAFTGIPFTIMAHANDIFERGMLLQRKAERSKKMITISEYNYDYLRNIGVPEEKLAIVRCGISFDSALIEKTFQRKSKYRIGTLGRLVEKKGMDVLIRAVHELRDKPYAIDLIVAGEGPLQNDLMQLAVELDQTDVVQFKGSIPHTEVQDWLKTLDIFVLACKVDKNGDMDGIPVALMEAMSQLVPVISTRLSGIPELIIDEKTGLLVAPADAHEMALQIDRLASSPELCNQLVLQGLTHVNKEFSQDINLDRLMSYFELEAGERFDQATGCKV